MPDIFVIGDANVDILVHYPRFLDDDKSRVIWPNPQVVGGGTCSNTAAALAKLGMQTKFLGTVGADPYGKFIDDDLRSSGVDTSGLDIREGFNTVGVFAFIDEKGERYLWGWPRVNQAFKEIDENHIDWEQLKKASWVHSSGMAITYDTSARQAIYRLFHEARAAGITTSFDLNLRVDDGALNREFEEALYEILPDVDYLLGSGPDEFAYLGTGHWLENARELSKDRTAVIVRDGPRGSIGISAGKEVYSPAFEVKVEDTVGAGDVFNAGFISAILNGQDLASALKQGNAVSGYSVARKGARDTPNIAELHQFMSSFPQYERKEING